MHIPSLFESLIEEERRVLILLFRSLMTNNKIKGKNTSICCEIIVKESREGGGRDNYIIDILRGVLHRAPNGLFIAKG